MTWNPSPKVTIGGVDFTANALEGVSVTYGRATFWDQPRASYCSINLANLNNTLWTFNINDSIVIQVKDSTGTYVTIFTGYLTTVSNQVTSAGSIADVVVQRITGIGSLAKMARVRFGGSLPKEFDATRINNILTTSGVSIDTVDSGVFELQSITKDYADCYQYAAYYAQMAFGYIYETRLGKVGFANESRRNIELNTVGHTNIATNTIIGRTLSSQQSLADLSNDVSLTWRAGTATASNSTSIATYGKAGATISTELHNQADADYQALKYMTLRSFPQTNLNSFVVQLDAPDMTSAVLDKLLKVYIGMAIQIDSLPNGVYNGAYNGFVESHTFTINRNQVALSLTTSEQTYSLTPTRWQDVSASLIWSAVDPALQWQDYS